ncbi:MAG: tetratricopeptide repeat protein [Chitinophagaceae bacterium]|nr:tetratricopeptide repeat protein [Chitinophagaceae bacterium]
MKRILPLVISIFLVGQAMSQGEEGMKKHYLKMYNNALSYNDPAAAINALHGFLALDSSLLYKDTLSMLYFTVKNYYSALLLSEEVYQGMPKNAEAGARAAECYDQLGDPKTSVKLYEEIVPKTKNPYHIYKLAVGQYQLKRTMECELSARTAMADTNSRKIGVGFTNGDGSVQAVPVFAASANLLGVLQMDAKNYAAAKNYFSEAVKSFPEFAGAKENIAACDAKLKGGTKPPVKGKGQ